MRFSKVRVMILLFMVLTMVSVRAEVVDEKAKITDQALSAGYKVVSVQPILSLEDCIVSGGNDSSFFKEEVWTYYVEVDSVFSATDKQKELRILDTNLDVYIVETDGISPCLVKFGYQSSGWMDYKTDVYVFYVPVGSVKTEFNLDGK